MIKNKLGIFLCIILALNLTACKLADIRTTEMAGTTDDARAMKVLHQMAKAHQVNRWDDIETYTFHVSDEYQGLIGTFGSPFPKGKAVLELSFIPQTYTGRGIFQDGKWKDKVWGIQAWETYSNEEMEKGIFHEKPDKQIQFSIPTYQYFIETPWRIFEANIIRYAGEREKNGQVYDLVFATWETEEPQKEMDQYLLWVNRKTGVLDLVQFTVRDAGGWVHCTFYYDHYESLDGLLFPTEMTVRMFGPEKENTLHKMVVDHIQIDALPKQDLLLDPSLGTNGNPGD